MLSEVLTIATQNTRSLGQGFLGRRKRRELKDIFKNTSPTTDILLLQETKLPEAACLKQARFLEFKGGTSLWNEGSFSAHSGRAALKGAPELFCPEKWRHESHITEFYTPDELNTWCSTSTQECS